jgi:hypothetical protein
VIWILFLVPASLLATAYCAYRVGRTDGADRERERCVDICAALLSQRRSASLRLAAHAIINGLEHPLTEAELRQHHLNEMAS